MSCETEKGCKADKSVLLIFVFSHDSIRIAIEDNQRSKKYWNTHRPLSLLKKRFAIY